MAEEEGQQIQQTSKYNEAINQLIRINNIWQQCCEYSSNGHLTKWKWKLEAAWRELSSSAKKLDESLGKDEKSWVKQKEEKDTAIANVKTREELYKALNDKEEFLRWLQDKAGKGSAYSDEDDNDFE